MASSLVLHGVSGVGVLESQGGRHVARGTNGVVWIVMEEASGATHYLVAYFLGKGAVQATREVIASGAAAYVGISVCVDTTDQPVVAYSRTGVTGVDFYRRESGTWTAKTGFTSNDSTGIEGHQILCRPDGKFDVVYTNHRSGTTTAFIFHRVNTVDLGGAWAAQTTVDSVVTSNSDIHLARRCAAVHDRSGTLHAAWVLRGTSSWPIKYASYNGTSWSSLETVFTPATNGTGFIPKHLSIAVDASNVPVLVYAAQGRNGAPGITGVWLTHRTGGTWSTPAEVHDLVAFSQTMPSVTIDQAGDVDVFWHGDGLISTLGYDSVYRATGTVSSLTVSRVADLTTGAVQTEVPHAWKPFGHGLFDAGYFAIAATSGNPPTILLNDDLSWVHEPVAKNTMGSAQALSKAGTQYALANALDFAQQALGPRDLLRRAENFLSFAQEIKLPRGANAVVFSQSASVAGSIWVRAAGNTLEFTQLAIRESPVACETEYVPSPPINASDDLAGSTSLTGPWPDLSRKVKLPLPTFGDMRGADLRVLTLRTMDGEVHQRARSGTLREFVVEFPQLSRRKAIELQDFIDAMTGQLVVWSDANGHRWLVVVTDPSASVRRHGIEYGGAIRITLSGSILT